MKTKLMGFVVAAGIVLSSAGVLGAAEAPALPDATAQAVLEYMKASSYQGWALMPGTERMRTGKQPHGALQNVYANDVAMKGFAAKSSPMPNGTLIVKENFTADSIPQGMTIMYKKAGYNPEAGDFFWLKVDANMKVQAEGKVAGCISCHTAAAGAKDYLRLSPMK